MGAHELVHARRRDARDASREAEDVGAGAETDRTGGVVSSLRTRLALARQDPMALLDELRAAPRWQQTDARFALIGLCGPKRARELCLRAYGAERAPSRPSATLLGSWTRPPSPEPIAAPPPELTSDGGEPLPEDVLARMNRLFAHDFSHVRVHVDAAAATAAKALGARALALGSHIYFGAGELRPGTFVGDRLLVHELTHVVQHDRGRLDEGRAGAGVRVSHPDDAAEREASAAEERATMPAPVERPLIEGSATPHATGQILRAPTKAAPVASEPASEHRAGATAPDVSAVLYFATNDFILDDKDEEVIARVLREAVKRAAIAEIDLEIDGYTDERPVRGDSDGNQLLSDLRATATRGALQRRIDALPTGLGRKALLRSRLVDVGHDTFGGGVSQAERRRVEIRGVVKPTLFERGLVTWSEEEPDMVTLAGTVTARELAIELYGDEKRGSRMTVKTWDKATMGGLTVDTRMPAGTLVQIQYPSLRPHLKEVYDATMHVTSRSEWGARDPMLGPGRDYDRYGGALEDVLDGIVVHHSGNSFTSVASTSGKHTMTSVQDEHLDEKERADVGYHFGINLEGEVFEGRPIDVKGSHVANGNTGKIGIVLLADLDTQAYDDDDTLTPAMESSLVRLVHYLRGKYPKVRFLGGHQEFAAGNGDERTCPGDLTMGKMESWRSSLGMDAPTKK